MSVAGVEIVENNGPNGYVIEGMGPMRPIMVDAESKDRAIAAYLSLYGRQYEEEAKAEYLALHGGAAQ